MADKSAAVLFRLRGEAETLVLAEKMRAEEERRARFAADRSRTERVDARWTTMPAQFIIDVSYSMDVDMSGISRRVAGSDPFATAGWA